MKRSKSIKIKALVLSLAAVGIISTAAACNHSDDAPSTTVPRVTDTAPPATTPTTAGGGLVG